MTGWFASFRERRRDALAARRNRADGSCCFYCGGRFTGEGGLARTADHRLARSAGGTDGLANLVFACYACNQRKADRPEDDFLASAWLAERRRRLADYPARE